MQQFYIDYGFYNEGSVSREDYLIATQENFEFFKGDMHFLVNVLHNDFRKVFSTLDRLKAENEKLGRQDLYVWGTDKGEGYDDKLQREMRELTYI